MFSESVRILTKAVCSSSKTLVEDDDDQVSLSCRKKYEAVWSCVSVRHKRLNHAFFFKGCEEKPKDCFKDKLETKLQGKDVKSVSARRRCRAQYQAPRLFCGISSLDTFNGFLCRRVQMNLP